MFGDDVFLLVDVNCVYIFKKVIEVGCMFVDYGVCYYEEFCLYWEFEWIVEVICVIEVLVVGGEQDCFVL